MPTINVQKKIVTNGHDHCDACGEIMPHNYTYTCICAEENDVYFKLCCDCLEKLGEQLFPHYLQSLDDDTLNCLYHYYKEEGERTNAN